MYNRYIPGSNGVYERRTVHEHQPKQEPCSLPASAEPPEEQPCCPSSVQTKRKGFGGLSLDTGDLLLLCIVLLLMIDSDGDDLLPLLITAAAFLFMQ